MDMYRLLRGVHVDRKTWTIVFKFGWPKERCPRRIEFLTTFVRILKKHALQDTPGISNPRIVGGDSAATGAIYEVQCEGTNFALVHRMRGDCIDHNRMYSNDVKAVMKFYGIEAARAVVIKELNRVFSVYGITVDFRHMSLVADGMTHIGRIRAFNRSGIALHSSPLLQMSFETSMAFLAGAVERGAVDDLRTPSGALVAGKPAALGTGICKALVRIPKMRDSKAATKEEKIDPKGKRRRVAV
eukprot:Polyplicarium_translucidae@DN2607_c0_g2_i1.p1